MHVDIGIWAKLRRVVVALLVLAAILGVAVWYLPVIKHNEALRKEILHLTSQIKQQEDIGKQLEISLKALSNDPRALERVAREKLSYVKPGETMIRFEEPATNTVPRR